MYGREFGGDDFDDDEDLVELERASAILDHRDPMQAEEVVAARRAAEEERARRADQLARLREVARKRRRVRIKRGLFIGAIVAVVGIAAVPITRAVMAEAQRVAQLQKALRQHDRAAAQLGFRQEKEWLDVPPAGVVFEIPRNSCSAVLGVAEGEPLPQPIRVERSRFGAIESTGGAVWCSCDAEEVKVKFTSEKGKRVALRWLMAPATTVGGIEVLTAEPIEGFEGEKDEAAVACADHAFDAWSQVGSRGRLAPLPKDRKGLTTRALEQGMAPDGLFPRDRVFAVIRSQPKECHLAIPEETEVSLALRAQDGRRLVSDASEPLAWCTYSKAATFSLWRKTRPSSDVVVVRAPAERVGGIAGLRELSERLGLGVPRSILLSGDLSGDTAAALRASSVAEQEISKATGKGLEVKPANLVVAFALLEKGSFLPEVTPTVLHACRPKSPREAPFVSRVCVQARPQFWRADGDPESQAASQAPLPFWLSVLKSSSSEDALTAAARMLAFARRMNLLGFEPTTSDGVKDTPTGAVVSGRSQEQTVAVGITRRAPWIHPLWKKGPPWKLEGPLRIVRVPENESVVFRSTRSLGSDPSSRRVVVWRH